MRTHQGPVSSVEHDLINTRQTRREANTTICIAAYLCSSYRGFLFIIIPSLTSSAPRDLTVTSRKSDTTMIRLIPTTLLMSVTTATSPSATPFPIHGLPTVYHPEGAALDLMNPTPASIPNTPLRHPRETVPTESRIHRNHIYIYIYIYIYICIYIYIIYIYIYIYIYILPISYFPETYITKYCIHIYM